MKTGSSQLRVHNELYRTNAPSSSQPYTFVRPTLDFGLRTLDFGLPAHHIGLGSIRIKLNCTQLHLIEVNQPGGYPLPFPVPSLAAPSAFNVSPSSTTAVVPNRAQSCTAPRTIAFHWMLDVGCWMLDVRCSMFDVDVRCRCSMSMFPVPISAFRVPPPAFI